MIIQNKALLKAFRLAGRCEWCGRAGGTDPHHVFGRGPGGGWRLDTPLTLVSLCRRCHDEYHAGLILQPDLVAVVAQREECLQADLIAVVRMLRKLPGKPWESDVAEGLKGLNKAARELARRILEECKPCSNLTILTSLKKK